MRTEAIWQALPEKIRRIWRKEELAGLQEIRLRCGQPLLLRNAAGICFLRQDGSRTENPAAGIRITAADLAETVSLLSGYSLYAFAEELRQGFLTIAGGHRVGFCGKAVLERGEIKTLRQINALNIRIAKEQIGWGRRYLPYLMENGRFCHTLIVSPPGCGKTTLLRDLIRCLSSGEAGRFITVGVVDERGEIAPLLGGEPQMDVGLCTDILEGCPKAKGMLLLLRSMAPEVIAVDELGSAADMLAAEEVLRAGVRLMATVHGADLEEIRSRPYLCDLIEKRIFGRYLFLADRQDGKKEVREIRDGAGVILWKEGEGCSFGSSAAD